MIQTPGLARRRFCQLVAGSTLASRLPAAPPPNVVLIVSDDHGWRDYGWQGHPHLRTPHLDRLAADSLTFPRGYLPAPLCCPSLASLITGLHPHQHKIVGNDPPRPAEAAKLPLGDYTKTAAFREGREVLCQHLDAVPTLPRLLAAQGYLSLQTGKWWQGDYRRGGFTHGMTTGGRHGDDGLVIGRQTMQPIADFLDLTQRESRPFLLWYAPMLPHQPHNPPERLLAHYRERTDSLHLARYWAMVEWFDETCGQLLDLLQARGLAANTVVAYLADNGWTQRPDAPGAVKSKLTPYDGGVRTPLLLRWPGRIAAARSNVPVSSIDLLPTLLRATGTPLPAGLPGLDLRDAPAVAARNAVNGACYTHDIVDLQVPARSLQHRWRVEGDQKVILPTKPGAAPELYDLAADPDETTTLASQRPAEVARLRAALDAWWTPA
ncbi:MAG: sulfatase-like hydrolase/transferase [Fimbriimonadaceae bacterium]|nr:sulfatase-like hydrolase/transferase [Fimbriimonadaceae bacterium]